MEGVLWTLRAQLLGAIENVRDLITNVNKGLDLVMSLGDELKTKLVDDLRLLLS